MYSSIASVALTSAAVLRNRDTMEFLEATYRIAADGADPGDRIEAILLEQTTETPQSVAARYPYVAKNMTGSVREVTSLPDGSSIATLALPVATASVDPSQFLNVLFGNSSLHDGIALEDFTLPPSVRRLFRGPRFGINGIREITGVQDRALTMSALKPVGLSLDEIAGVCRSLAEGGIDIIKDDHYLADHPFAPFSERVERCLEAVADVYEQSGHRAIYVPNLSGTPEEIHRQIETARAFGVRAVMAAPMLLGLPTFMELVERHLDVPVFAHPAFSGSGKIEASTLFGKLFRLFGADAVIFANYGGRFSYSREVCGAIAERLRGEWEGLAPSFPVPAGGMHVDRSPELVSFFGSDAILLVGGSLLEFGPHLVPRTRAFVDSVREAAAAHGDRSA